MEINGTIFVQIFIFMSLLLLLSNTLFSPLLKLFDERERRIEKTKEGAFEIEARANNIRTQIDEKLATAKEDAKKILHDKKALAEKKEISLLDELKQQEKQNIEAALKKIMAEEKSAEKDILTKSDDLANDIVTKILHNKKS